MIYGYLLKMNLTNLKPTKIEDGITIPKAKIE
jgi:hypothetical protein